MFDSLVRFRHDFSICKNSYSILFQIKLLIKKITSVYTKVLFFKSKVDLKTNYVWMLRIFIFLEKKMHQISYYLFCPTCKKGKIFKNSYDAFDENGYCLLSESTKKDYSFLWCNRTNFINFNNVFNKETIIHLKFQLKYSTFAKLLESFILK